MAAIRGRLAIESIYYQKQNVFSSLNYKSPLITSFSSNRKSRPLSTTSTSGGVDEYDFIVVGAGSAGCTLANRLSLGDDKTRVLVTEAGPAADQSWKVRIPSGAVFCMFNKRFDWIYETAPQKHLNGRTIFWPRGRVLGGSSSINGMIYIRGHAADYDRWAFKEGATGWSYAECLPYFIRSQRHVNGKSKYRGDSGNLHVIPGSSQNILYDAFIQAGLEAGYPFTEDFNGVHQEGFGRYDFTIRDGQRASAAAMYLRPAMNEAGARLRVSADSLVHRVLVNGRKAVGIEYQTGGPRTPLKRAYASREVILSGGAVNSPQLLKLSGIGPAEELRGHNIQLVQHSPGVGTNLQDHLRINLHYKCTKPVSINSNMCAFIYTLRKPDQSSNYVDWLANNGCHIRKVFMGQGSLLPHRAIPKALRWFLTSSGQTAEFEAGCFIKSRPDVEHPDIQIHFFPGTIPQSPLPLFSSHAFEVVVNTLRATSRGTVKLKSVDPYEHPVIDPNYLHTTDDVQDMRTAVKLTRKVIAQRAFDEYRGDEIVPGKAAESDEEIDACIREKANTIYHPSGTCRMGSSGRGDDDVVVDSECRVVGVEGLRVVDASVMPSNVSGNTNAPTIMIAERVSDMILGKATLLPSSV